MATLVRDDLGRELVFVHPPRRIVSLVPSDTYSLFAISAGDRVVGRTDYCVEPAGARAIPSVGGTKNVDVDAVRALKPDLVLGNQEENTKTALETLAQHGLPVWVSFPRRFSDGIAHLARLARALGLGDDPDVRALVKRGYDLGRRGAGPMPEPVPTFVPIWNDPLMTFSADTYASDLLSLCGARNVFADRLRNYPLAADLGRHAAWEEHRIGDRDRRYPRIAEEEICARAPALVLLPDEPFAFGPAERDWAQRLDTPAARSGATYLCSGKDLFWYGAWSIEGLPRLRALVALGIKANEPSG